MPPEVEDVEDDLFDDEDEDVEPEEEVETPEPEAEAPKPKAKKAKPAAAPVDTGPSEAQLAEFGLNALKQAFISDAKAAGFVAADFDGIGMKGIDDEARAAFVKEAEASHTAKVDALAAQGFVYNPEAAGTAGKQAELDAEEARQAQQWGKSGPGQAASGEEKFDDEVADEVKSGDVMGVIGSLVGKGKMGEFFIRGRRS